MTYSQVKKVKQTMSKKTKKTKTKSKGKKPKWGVMGAPHSAKRKAYMKKLRAKRGKK
jgi:hypothetical protein